MKHQSLVVDFVVLQRNLLFLKLNSISAVNTCIFQQDFLCRKITCIHRHTHIYFNKNKQKMLSAHLFQNMG